MTITHKDSLLVSLKLWIVTVLLTVLGVAIVAEYTSEASYSDDTVRIRMLEMEELDTDNDVALHAATILYCLSVSSFVLLPVQRFAAMQYVDFLLHRTALVQLPHLRGPPLLVRHITR
jgi:hypothetical protein